jgi:hypothetical protein
VQKNDRGTIGGACFRVTDVEDAGVDLLQRRERGVRSRLDRRQRRRSCPADLRVRRRHKAELSGDDGAGCSTDQAAPLVVEVVRHCDPVHWRRSGKDAASGV